MRRHGKQHWLSAKHGAAVCLLVPLLIACLAPRGGFASEPAAPGALESGADGADTATTSSTPANHHFGPAMLEILGINTLVWSYDRYVRSGGGEGFRIGFESWGENVKNGFEWDDNNFGTNQFAHPYHGNLYFNAARANGYDFWGAIPLTCAGSFMWEYFAETHHPAINDWVNTSVGGIVLGEVLYRLSSAILDNTATGAERTWRELGGFAVNPMRGLTRLVTGETFRVGDNPPGRFPSVLGLRLEAGLRTVGQEEFGQADTTRAFLDFSFAHGDPFQGDLERPFDHFDFGIQVNFNDQSPLGQVRAKGLLHGGTVRRTESTHHILAAFQHFDYIDNRAYEFGGQSLGAGFLSRFTTEHGYELRTELYLNALLLGATLSDYLAFTGREYDYGPGLGFKIAAGFGRNGWRFVDFSHTHFWIHSVNGNQTEHYISLTRIKLSVPVTRHLAVGTDYLLYLAEGRYDDYPDISRRNPQLRAYLAIK